MGVEKSILQICVSCKPDKYLPEGDVREGEERSGAALFQMVEDRLTAQPVLSERLTLQPVECMNACQQGCSAVVRADGKYSFVIGNLDQSDARIDDLLAFGAAHSDKDDGLPAWRARPEFVRKNTLVRLHPVGGSNPSSQSSSPSSSAPVSVK